MIGFLVFALFGCAPQTTEPREETIRIGALLPFTGSAAAIGRNLEQAMLLATEDVNRSGGIAGTRLQLVVRDSNSGSERGLSNALDLLYNERVQYLIGPEENDLASELVTDIKALNVLNILPGYAAPPARRVSTSGAWLRLAPSTRQLACAIGSHAALAGYKSLNTLSSADDFNSNLAAEVSARFAFLGGTSRPSATVDDFDESYEKAINRAFGFNSDVTLLIAYPGTAANIVTEWTIMGRRGQWSLSSLLRTDAFLRNIPSGTLDGTFGLSPPLSLATECEQLELNPTYPVYGEVHCRRDNAERFRSYFAARWDGTQPLTASHLYYDAVMLLAMGLQYAVAAGDELPEAPKLQRVIRQLNGTSGDFGAWFEPERVLRELAKGVPLRLTGAGAEYSFDQFGEAAYQIYDTWTVHAQSIVDAGSYFAYCPN